MKYAKIGGQAVIEGIMMRCGDDYAVAVRTPDRHIEIKKEQYRGLVSRFKMRRVPIIRGVLAFVDSLYLGMKTLTYSAGFYEDEEEEAKESGHGAKTEHPRVSEEKESFGDKVLMGAHGCRVHCGCSRLIYDSAVFHFQFIQPCDIIRIPAVTD